MRFRNPLNGYEEEVGIAWPWCLLFGPLYFAAKGVWSHAAISLIVAIATGGLSWLVYPFFARAIVEQHYLRNGWLVATASASAAAQPSAPLRELPRGTSRPSIITSILGIGAGVVMGAAAVMMLAFDADYLLTHAQSMDRIEAGAIAAMGAISIAFVCGSVVVIIRGVRKQSLGALGWFAIIFVGVAVGSAIVQGVAERAGPLQSPMTKNAFQR